MPHATCRVIPGRLSSAVVADVGNKTFVAEHRPAATCTSASSINETLKPAMYDDTVESDRLHCLESKAALPPHVKS